MRIILISSDPVAAKAIERSLLCLDMDVFSAETGEEGIDLARHYDHDGIVLDMRLSDMNGIDAIRKLRLARVQSPIMTIGESANISVKVQALECGADDFMTKPFDISEFVARLRALVRRSRGYAQSSITNGPITINLSSKRVSVNGSAIHLSQKEYKLLELLTLRRGMTLNKEAIIAHLYHNGEGPASRTVDLFVCRLRKKLAAATGGDNCIETVNQQGYHLRRHCAA